MENRQIHAGIVIGIEDNRIAVQMLPAISGECGTSCRCKALAMVEESKGPKIWIKGNYKNQFKINDFVKIEADLPSAYTGIFFLFILPMIGLFFGALSGHFLAEKYSLVNQQIFSIIGAGTGIFIAIGIAILFDLRLRSKKEVFRIQEIPSLKEEAHQECRNSKRHL